MDDAVARTLKAFENLTDKQKEDFKKQIRGHEVLGGFSKTIKEELSVNLGPLSGRCVYCGK